MEIERNILFDQCYGLLDILLYLIEEEEPEGNVIFNKVDNLFKQLSVEMKLTQDEYNTLVRENRRI